MDQLAVDVSLVLARLACEGGSQFGGAVRAGASDQTKAPGHEGRRGAQHSSTRVSAEQQVQQGKADPPILLIALVMQCGRLAQSRERSSSAGLDVLSAFE